MVLSEVMCVTLLNSRLQQYKWEVTLYICFGRAYIPIFHLIIIYMFYQLLMKAYFKDIQGVCKQD